jgi:hypothetical protein
MSRTAIAHAEVITGNGIAFWLLDVEIGGYTYRASNDDVSVVDANGTTWTYRAGLALDTVTVRSDGDTSVQCALSADVQGTPDGWPAVLLGPPHGGKATLRRWLKGQLLDEARVLVDGEIYDAEFDDPDAPLLLSIRWLAQTPVAVPPPQAMISALTWPATANYIPDETVNGACYPLVFGTPGYRDDVPWGDTILAAYTTPAYLGQHNGAVRVHSGGRLVIGWVPDGTTYHASTVTVWRPHDDTTSTNGRGWAAQVLTVSTTADLLGRTLATCAPIVGTSANNTIRFVPGREYWVRWNGGGGVYNEARDGSMRKAGEIIAYLLRLAGLKVNAGRMAAARGRLDRYLLDFAMVASVTDVRSFIESEIGALIPLVRRTSADGMWYEALNYFPSPADAVLHLVVPAKNATAASYREDAVTTTAAGVLVARASTIAWTDDPITNTLAVRYAFARGQSHTQEVVVTGGTPSSTRGEIGSVACASSRARFGPREGGTVDARLVHDRATAEVIAVEMAARAAIPRRLCSFAGDVADLEVLEPGDVVRVTDTERRITSQFALVKSIEYGLTGIVVDVEILDHLTAIGSV